MNIKLFNEDNLEVMKGLSDESIDVICIDPPYLYLKNQKLERPFDERKFFSECRRLLTKNGFIVMFGRGESFYRWNTILADLKFTFKEEIIWDKKYSTSPVLPLSRCHETISIFCKGNAKINAVKIQYDEFRTEHDIDKVIADVNRLKSVLNNEKSLNHVLNYLNGTRSDMEEKRSSNYATSCQTKALGSQTVSPMKSIKEGMKNKSIISLRRDHYNTIHPTQKPVPLLERLLALAIPQDKPREEIVVADFFAGSMSCMEAVHNMGMQGIACEIDKEYFEAGRQRINSLNPILL
ncbi:DNA-methyltransferase [Elizabethkingia anophelis]|uniref:Methyltransferase n=1 Tax=Elizabethkingia anophelis TaxID=1117645 RepID=A0AAE4T4Z9_9FLAO|nr:site-specific DNA-methyltransferase [Elizabethkingia anophelis]MDV3665467.1 site-specific DNA-methyltransferase [Elizabethkingia anophelis]MDV3845000.1 site-specific DNA-methyltransferase [Elizabethkingia anophelis]RBA34765.1 site-specific DNA-methyltransferase [Elizabethkingia anophelis]WGL71017.1 site-specific DNA-methyltransferase [Elizabethkingia anophelis]HCZ8394618.1 site-specific DNA-methyltransferase [Elizabethkingia anophelis]